MAKKARLATYLFHIEYDIVGYTKDSDHDDGKCRLVVENTSKNRILFEESSQENYKPKTGRSIQFSAKAQDGEDFSGDTIEWRLKDVSVDSDAGRFKVSWASILESDHTHPPEPGVQDTFDGAKRYPENCDVLVNGSSVNVSLGAGDEPFFERVDLSGELQSGRENIVEITSDEIGDIIAHLDVDAYRQILGEG